ncbi:MAG: YkgJ family cysteine cluster protein [Candidatus Diapherotrites archaeon]|nr:YkgJ family cysteine cluster protein [Candidatus Diapherotrites archaeon]
MQLNCLKLHCSKCCQSYWISLLPAEAKKIAKALGLSERDFIERNCVLLAHLYPAQGQGKTLLINAGLLPKKLALAAEKEPGFMTGHFLVLPFLALKRKADGSCIFLAGGKCKVHGARPRICSLFPFVAVAKRPLKEVYPFCEALQQKGFENATGWLDESYRKRTSAYLDSVGRKGFQCIWPALPSKAVVLLGGEKQVNATKKEFLQLIQPFA